jgi:DNA-binding response OmpR family regulator
MGTRARGQDEQQAANAGGGETPSSSGPTKEAKPVLLVADADRLTLWSLEHFLGDGYTVIQAPTSAEAMDFLGRSRADAVVISDNLPDGVPSRLVECAIRRVSSGPVVLLQPLVQEPREGLPDSVVVLEKPFDLEHLKALLENPRAPKRPE